MSRKTGRKIDPSINSGENKNLLEKFKDSLLKKKIIAIFVLCFIIISAILTLSLKLIDLSKFFTKKKDISISTYEDTYIVGLYEIKTIEVNLIFISEEKIAMDDAVLELSFKYFDDKINKYIPIPRDKLYDFLYVEKLQFKVPPLDPNNNRTSLKINITGNELGKFILSITCSSHRLKIHKLHEVELNIIKESLDYLTEYRDSKFPIFVARNNILNISPKLLWKDVYRFSIVLYEEYINTDYNLPRSILLFQSNYIGALGGLIFDLYMISPIMNFDIDKISQNEPQNTHKVGSINFIESDIVPIGTSFYKVSLLDQQRIKFEKTNLNLRKVLGKIRLEFEYYFDKLIYLGEIPIYNIPVYLYSTCGATGRNCFTSLTLGTQVYEDWWQCELGHENYYKSDFPIILKVTSGRYLYIDFTPNEELIFLELANVVHSPFCSKESLNYPILVQSKGKYGFIDRSGNYISNNLFEDANHFCEGLAAIQINKKWGFINKKAALVIELKYDFAGEYSEERALIGLLDNNNIMKYGFVDLSGNLVIKPEYIDALNFSEGLAAVKIGDKWGYIDKNGMQKIHFRFASANKFNEGLALVEVKKDKNDKSLKGFINYEGKFIITPKYGDAQDFSNGLAPVLINETWGYVDRIGNVAIKPKFKTAFRFKEGFALVQIGEKLGFIDKSGEIKIPPKFDIAGFFNCGIVFVKWQEWSGSTGFFGKEGWWANHKAN